MRRFSKIAAVALVGALALTGCGSKSGSGASGSSADNDVCKSAKGGDGPKIGVAYDVGGRGDQSFNDSAYKGMEKAVKDLGVDLLQGYYLAHPQDEPSVGDEEVEASLKADAERRLANTR